MSDDDNARDGGNIDDIQASEVPMLDALSASLPADAPPLGMNERSESLLGWLDVDDELSGLLADAVADPEGQLSGVRSGTATADDLAASDGVPVVEWNVEGAVVSGLVMVDSVTSVELQLASGDIRRAALSDLGRFTLDDVPSGPVRLRLSHRDGRVDHTRWFVV